MKFLEYEAKEIFKEFNIPLPTAYVAKTPNDAQFMAEKIGHPVAVKAQILAGGRGKAGGIKFEDTPLEAKQAAENLLSMVIKGHEINAVLIEEKLSISQEIYLGITLDRENQSFVVIISSAGGIAIEEVARTTPEKILKTHIDAITGLHEYQARRIAKQAGFTGKDIVTIAFFIHKLWQIVTQYDAELVEINPLVKTQEGKYIAADARLIVDDNALYRHPTLNERLEQGKSSLSPLELAAQEEGMAYVELDGEIGIIGNGAGLVMATMDTISLFGGHPANFLDVGGGATANRMEIALDIILKNPHVKLVFINIMGGITRCDDMARGIINGVKNHPLLKLVVRLVGTREAEGKAILIDNGIPVLDSMDAAAEQAVRLLE